MGTSWGLFASQPGVRRGPEEFFKIENLDFHEALSNTVDIVDLSCSEGQLGAQICFEEAWKLRKKELEETEIKQSNKKDSKKLARVLPGVL